jgi:hypothetical protein
MPGAFFIGPRPIPDEMAAPAPMTRSSRWTWPNEARIEDFVVSDGVLNEQIKATLPHCPAKDEGVTPVDPDEVYALEEFLKFVSRSKIAPEIKLNHAEAEVAQLVRLLL